MSAEMASVAAVASFALPAHGTAIDNRFPFPDANCSVTVIDVTRDYDPLLRRVKVRIAVNCSGDAAETYPYGIVVAQAMNRDSKEHDVSPGSKHRFVLRCNARRDTDHDWRREVRPVWMGLFAEVLDGQGVSDTLAGKTQTLPWSC